MFSFYCIGGFFLKGLHVGETPIFDGICAHCGSLLYGPLNQPSISNKTNGRPVRIDGSFVTGATAADAQPPFLLRWSPDVFAEMVPDVFFYSKTTNRLGLHEAHVEQPPWRARAHHHRAFRGHG